MPGYAGLIKYPLPGEDKYSTTYGEPQWWRDLAVTANAAAATPHGLIENRLAVVTLDSAGGVQHQVGGQQVWWVNHTGRLVKGTVPWSLIDGAPEPPELTQPATLKVTPLALTTGQSNALHNAAQSVRVPVRFNAPLVRWRLHIRNWNPRTGTVTAAPVDFTGLWLADTSGAGTVTGTPTQISPAFTTPANGDEWVSDWVDTPLGGDVERLLCFGYTSTAQPPRLIGGSYQNHDPAQAISGAAHGANSVSPFDMWIEAETPATTPVVAGVGDSMTSGTGATLPVHESWVSQYARTIGGLPLHLSHHGDSMSGFLGLNSGKVTRWDHLARADAVVWGLGQNDLGDGRSFEQMKADFATLRPIVEAAVGPVHYVSTIQPRNSWDASQEADRIAWNAWITAQGFRGVLDFASVVSADGDTIRPEYDSGDGGHLNTAGYAAEAASITVPLTAPKPVTSARVDSLEAALYDSGLRDITSVLSLQSGSIRLHVRNGFVWIDFNDVVLNGTGVVVLTDTALASVAPALPMGGTSFTVATLAGSARRVTLNRYGQLRVFAVSEGDSLNGSGVWPMRRPTPIPLIGDPA